MAFYTWIQGGVAPYNGVAKNFSGTVVHTITNNDNDEIQIPDVVMDALIGGIVIEITDADGKFGTVRFDNGTLRVKRRCGVGSSVSNGNSDNHVAKLIEGEEDEFAFVGVMFEASDLQNDSDLASFTGLPPFNATIPLPEPPAFFFDKTVHAARSNSICNMIRINIWLQRNMNRLNNGTTVTQFIGLSDSMMRPDGTTPIVRPSGDMITDVMVPSYAAANTLDYAERIFVPFFKRYIQSINDATVIAIGAVMTSNGEGEINFVYKVGNTTETHMGSERTHGDFHPESVARFKSRFPMYSGTSNVDIANASRTSDLGMRWRWHNNQLIIDFEHALIDRVIAAVPGLERVKHWQHDSGSYLDELGLHRSTYNVEQRIHPASFLWKSNDETELPSDTMDYIYDQGTSLALKSGGIFMTEPSPTFPYTDHLPSVRTAMLKAHARGGWISFFSADRSVNQGLVSTTGIPGAGPAQSKNQYKIVGGNKKLLTHTINISEVLKHGAFAYEQAWMVDCLAFRSANGLTHVDTHTIDNVNPDSGI